MEIIDYFKVWIDADACPKIIKELVFAASQRVGFKVSMVANSYMFVPPSALIELIKVDQGADVADSFIVENLSENDLIITADIPLAALVVEKGALAINPRGEPYTEDNVSERLSMRDFMKDLRDSGMVTGGPAPFGPKDKEKFANSFNKIITSKVRKNKS
jgi:hypothetical protein